MRNDDFFDALRRMTTRRSGEIVSLGDRPTPTQVQFEPDDPAMKLVVKPSPLSSATPTTVTLTKVAALAGGSVKLHAPRNRHERRRAKKLARK